MFRCRLRPECRPAVARRLQVSATVSETLELTEENVEKVLDEVQAFIVPEAPIQSSTPLQKPKSADRNVVTLVLHE